MNTTLLTIVKGAAMGIAEVIPGVSGGTIAFITGIYERLLKAIKSFNPSLIKVWKSDGFSAVWQKIDGYFLMKLIGGMAAGFIFGLFAITYLLDNFPVHIWSVFFGLIFASIFVVGKQVSRWNPLNIILLIGGTFLVYYITIAAPSQGSEEPIFVFAAAVIAISALMLPGLSGSFMLLLMGMYTIIMPSLKNFLSSPFGPETKTVLAFAAGALVGVFTFANVLTWLFNKYRNATLAVLTGFLIGSLNKVWPWQKVLDTRVNSKGETVPYITESVLPKTFSELGPENIAFGNESYTIGAVILMVVSALTVFLLNQFSKSNQ